MNFRPELAEKVMRGEKTVTRRLVSENPHSPWYREQCSLRVNRTYAVCPGRGKNAVGRVRIVSVRREPVGWLTDGEARAEGFDSPMAFAEAFGEINGGGYHRDAEVWRVEFVVVPPEDYALWEGSTPTKTQERP